MEKRVENTNYTSVVKISINPDLIKLICGATEGKGNNPSGKQGSCTCESGGFCIHHSPFGDPNFAQHIDDDEEQGYIRDAVKNKVVKKTNKKLYD